MQTREDYLRFIVELVSREKHLLQGDRLIRLGNEAAGNALHRTGATALTEDMLAAEIDRLIEQRLRLPSYDAWLEAMGGGGALR